jgi:hypothetical protein
MCTDGERTARRVLAKKLLLHTLRLGDGQASELADNFTDEQLEQICAINARPPWNRRQEIKAVLSQMVDASRVTASLPATTPDPEPAAEPDGRADEATEEDDEDCEEDEPEPETTPEPPRKPKRPKPN